MIACDGQGQKRWQFPCKRLCSIKGNPPRFVRSLACADGELLLFSVGLRLVAIDAPESGVGPRAVDQNMEDLNAMSQTARCRYRQLSCPGISTWIKSPGGPLARFWAAEQPLCVFLWFSNLVAADPRNGKTLWIRRDLPQAASFSETTGTCSCFRRSGTRPWCCVPQTANWPARERCRR